MSATHVASTETLLARLRRSEQRVKALETLIETRSRELYEANVELEVAHQRLAQVLHVMPCGLFSLDGDAVVRTNAALLDMLGRADPPGTLDALAGDAAPLVRAAIARGDGAPFEVELSGDRGRVPVWLAVSTSCVSCGVVGIATDLRERKQLEQQLRSAQKQEAIAQLAAGIAHEINTPLQFVGDSLEFLVSAWEDATAVLRGRATPDEVELEDLETRVPRAFQRTREGLGRVVEIVRSMKVLSHPSHAEKEPFDLLRTIESAVAVTRHEHKMVADVSMLTSPLPPVWGHPGEIGQVLVTLIVNACHAIESAGRERGRISIRSRADGDRVLIEVQDDGTGIALEHRERVFEPFFTTKPVGKGTGQGLAIARQIVEGSHGGTLSFTSEPGRGTTFRVTLPVRGEREGHR